MIKQVKKIIVGPEDSPVPPHYAIVSSHRVVNVVPKNDGELLPTAISIDLETMTDYLSHHLAHLDKNSAGEVDIDGVKIPQTTYSRIAVDAAHGFLANHGISANLNKIRDELCADCLKNK